MSNFTFNDSAGNRTKKTKRWVGWLTFCGMLLLGQIGFAYLLPNLKEASNNELAVSAETEIVAPSNNTMQMVSNYALDNNDPTPCSQVSEQETPTFNGYFFGGTTNQLLAIDIPAPVNVSEFAIETIKIGYLGTATYFDILIHADNGGVPGTVLHTFEDVTYSSVLTGTAFDYDVYMGTVDISSENLNLSFPSSSTKYWMQVVSDAVAWEARSTPQVGAAGVAISDNVANWVFITDFFGSPSDLVYELIGECTLITCPFPTNVTLTQGTSDVTVNWTSSGTSFEVQWGLTGFALGNGTPITGISTNSTTIGTTTLDNGIYQVYVRQDCGVDGFSRWAGPYSFGIGYYGGGDIPTLYIDDVNTLTSASATCTPPHTMTIDVPFGYMISNINVQYSMTTGDGAWMSEQRSALWSPTLNSGESTVAAGTGGAGTYTYNRNTTFAYGATGSVDFQLKAWRDWGDFPDCGTNYNKVDNGTWIVTPTFELVPDCPSPIALQATQNSITSITLGWISDGDLFEVEWGSPGFTQGSGTPINNITTNSTNITVAAETPYEFYVRRDCTADNDGYSDWQGPFPFMTIGYCVPSSVNTSDMITSFVTTGGVPNNITNTDSGFSTGGYGNFTTMSVEMYETGTIGFTVTNNINMGVNIWVDWDNNYIFDESEKVYASGATGTTFSGSITVPVGTPLGNYRMRVRSQWANANPLPCGQVTYAEAEDYTLTVVAPPTCLPPTQLGANINTLTEAELFWTSDGNLFEVEYGLQGFTLGTGTPIGNILTNSTTVSGLTANTFYHYYVRRDCGGGDISYWAGPFTFYTNYCEATTEWTGDSINSVVSSGAIVNFSNTNNGTSPNGYGDFTNFAVEHFAGGEMELTVTTDYSMSVNIWIDWNNNMIFDSGELVYEGLIEQTIHTVLITVPTGTPIGDYRIRIRAGSLWSTPVIVPCGMSEYGETEDYTFTVIPTPPCMPPTALSSTSPTLTSAELSWIGGAGTFELEYGTLGFTPGTGAGTVISPATSPLLLDGLTAGIYEFYVRQDCGINGLSYWAGPHSFGIGFYSGGHIPTQYGEPNSSASPTCTPPATLTIDVPPGYQIANINVQYSMTTGDGAWMEEQRSALWSPTLNSGEPTIAEGVGLGGTYTYNRNTTFAEGATGSVDFQLKAWRTWGDFPDCGTNYNRVDNNTWIITPTFELIPDCPKPLGLSATPTSLTNVTLSWMSAFGNTFDVQWGAAGFTLGNGFEINGITGTSTNVTVVVDTEYQFYVRLDCTDDNDGHSAWAGPFNFKTGYCVPVYQNGCDFGAFIANFETFDLLENIANSTGCGGDYNNFSNISATAIDGTEVSFVAEVGSMWASGVKIWVDWNSNGVFESNELMASSANTVTGNFTGNFMIPLGSTGGEYRLRVRVVEDTTNFDACSTGGYGETEDYKLIVIDQPDCMFPQNLSASNISASSVLLSWNSDGNVFDIEYGPAGFVPGTGEFIYGVSNPYTLGGLTGGADYDFYVRQDCTLDNDGHSMWRGPVKFTPGVFIGDIPSMLNANPQVEDVACASLFGIDVPAGKQIASITVEYTMTSSSPAWESHQRSVIWSPSLEMGESQVFSHPIGGGADFPGLGIYERTIDFANGIQGPTTVEFQLKAWRTSGGTGCDLDLVYVESGSWVLDATFEDIPSCPNPPVDLDYTNITANSVDLVWASDETTGTFQVKWGNIGFDVEDEGTTISNINGLSHTLSNLDSSIPYEFYVRRDCSTIDDEDYGDWIGPVRFNSGHCIPYSNQWFYFSTFVTTGALENISYLFTYDPTELGSGYVDSTNLVVKQDAGESFNFSSNYVGGASGLRIWVDWDNDFVFENGEEVFFLASGTGQKSGAITIPANTPDGLYRMRVRAQQGAASVPSACGMIATGEALDFMLQVGDLNVSDFNSFGFKYYPNPVSEQLYLNANAPISEVKVINMLGQQVNAPANSDNTIVDMSGLPTGNYLIKVTIEGVSKMLKVVKK